VTKVSTPQAAVEAAQRTAFDLIVMDQIFDSSAGGMLGSDAIRQIRRLESMRDLSASDRALIVVCTARAMDESTEELFREANAVWPKPCPYAADGSLKREVATLMSRRPPRRTSGASSPLTHTAVCVQGAVAPSPQDRMVMPRYASVLVADDVAMNTTLLELSFAKLRAPRWAVTKVSTPQAAVEAAERTAFDLIIMDQIFSREAGGVLGTDAIRQIRQHEHRLGAAAVKPAVIVMCSAMEGLEEEEERRDAGVDAVWGKPFPNAADGSLQRELSHLLAFGQEAS